MKRSLINAAILGALGLGVVLPSQSWAASIKLCAGEFDIPADSNTSDAKGFNNDAPIRMWGYALGEDDGSGGCKNQPTSPGPSLQVNDSTLTITLYNTLPRATSLVIPGLFKPMAPTYITPGNSTSSTSCTGANCRVQSFDAEAATGAGTATYTWNNVKPGSYLYQSGTHQQLQVQMGLVGSVSTTAAPFGDNNTPSLAYDGMAGTQQPRVLMYTEIDPAIHEAVKVNPGPGGAYTAVDMESTIGYAPKYFGITYDAKFGKDANGEDNWNVASLRRSTANEQNMNVALENANDVPLMLRMINASTRIHTPTLLAGDFKVVAEDGNLYPNPRIQYAVALPPLKTKDAFLDTSALGVAGGKIRLTDSAMNLSNPAPIVNATTQEQSADDVRANGEDTVHFEFEVKSDPSYVPQVYVPGSSPIARKDYVEITEGDQNVAIDVLNNDEVNNAKLALYSTPKHGVVTLENGVFTYSHDGLESNRDSFLYSLTADDGYTAITGVVLKINQKNDKPTAVSDDVTFKANQKVQVRVLDNDKDPEGARKLKVVAVDAGDFDGEVGFVEKAVILSSSKVGKATLTYTIEDEGGEQDTANINVLVEEDTGSGSQFTSNTTGESGGSTGASGVPPVAKDDEYSLEEGGTYDILGDPAENRLPNKALGVLSNDTSNGGKVVMDEYPKHGSIEMAEDGTFRYIHDGSEEREDSFSYYVFNKWGSDKAEVNIKLVAKKDVPHVNNDKVRVRMNTSKVIDVLDNDKDKDSKVRKARMEIVKMPDHGTVSIGADNKVSYKPDDGFTGRDTFEYRLFDDETQQQSDRDGKVYIRVK